jgi:hypothetical protein
MTLIWVRRLRIMISLLSFHAAAAARGDGLRAELLAALARNAVSSNSGVTTRSDGMIQSGPDPASGHVTKKFAELVPFPRPKRIREMAP